MILAGNFPLSGSQTLASACLLAVTFFADIELFALYPFADIKQLDASAAADRTGASGPRRQTPQRLAAFVLGHAYPTFND